MRNSISPILESLHTQHLDEDNWVTIDGNRVLLGNNGESKTDPKKKTSDSKPDSDKKKAPKWKGQLKKAAKSGQMPVSIMGSREQQSEIFKEINKLYKEPDIKTHSIVDQGDGIWVNYGGKVSRSSYPSGKNASQEEKDGVRKWVLYMEKQKREKK